MIVSQEDDGSGLWTSALWTYVIDEIIQE